MDVYFASAAVLAVAAMLVSAYILLKCRKRPARGSILVRTGPGGMRVLRDANQRCFCLPRLHRVYQFKPRNIEVKGSTAETDSVFTSDQVVVAFEFHADLTTLLDDESIIRLLMTTDTSSQSEWSVPGVVNSKIAQFIKTFISGKTIDEICNGCAIDDPDIIIKLNSSIKSHGFSLAALIIDTVTVVKIQSEDGDEHLSPNAVYHLKAEKQTENEEREKQQENAIQQQTEEQRNKIEIATERANSIISKQIEQTQTYKNTIQDSTDRFAEAAGENVDQIDKDTSALLQTAKQDSDAEVSQQRETEQSELKERSAQTSSMIEDRQAALSQRLEKQLVDIEKDVIAKDTEFSDLINTAKRGDIQKLESKESEMDSQDREHSEQLAIATDKKVNEIDEQIARQLAEKEKAEEEKEKVDNMEVENKEVDAEQKKTELQ
jgi:hypothetical protein